MAAAHVSSLFFRALCKVHGVRVKGENKEE